MFDLGWTELLLIGVVALIVVGPKDLPGMFRTLGKATGKVRRMAREFQRAMEDAADESGVGDVAKGLQKAANPKKMGLDALNDAAEKFNNWEPGNPDSKKVGPETAKLSQERAEAARKIHEYSAQKAAEKRATEATASEVADAAPTATEAEEPPKS